MIVAEVELCNRLSHACQQDFHTIIALSLDWGRVNILSCRDAQNGKPERGPLRGQSSPPPSFLSRPLRGLAFLASLSREPFSLAAGAAKLLLSISRYWPSISGVQKSISREIRLRLTPGKGGGGGRGRLVILLRK